MKSGKIEIFRFLPGDREVTAVGAARTARATRAWRGRLARGVDESCEARATRATRGRLVRDADDLRSVSQNHIMI